MSGYKSTSEPARVRTILIAVATVAVLIVGSFVIGRTTAPDAPGATGIRFENGVPTGFPPTARGAGDAAAAYESFLSANKSLPREEAREFLETLIVEDSKPLVEKLMPSYIDEGNPGIAQATTLRVWADKSDLEARLQNSAEITVKLYSLVLLGGVTDGKSVQQDFALSGGFWVHTQKMRLVGGNWRIVDYYDAVNVISPAMDGTVPSGLELNREAIAEIAGRDSWVPGTVR